MATAEAHVPPQNLEAEESVLGALMVSESTHNAVILDVRLEAQDFYRDRHRLIYKAIKRLYERSDPIDAITVSELLRSTGELEQVGGATPSRTSPRWCRRRATPTLREDRPTELAAAPAARRLADDPGLGSQPRG
jgi:Replicative DNA helicase